MNTVTAVSLALLMLFGSVRGQPTDGQVRLYNQGDFNTNAGVVEIYYKGEWGTVCRGRYWNVEAADITCRQAGFARSVRNANPTDYSDPSSYPIQKIWLDDVSCSGYEQYILDCVDRPGRASCSYDEYVALVCADARLVDTTPRGYSGRVEVYNEGHWYGICGAAWSQFEAELVCNMLFPGEHRPADVGATSVSYASTDNAVPLIRCQNDRFAETLHECQCFFDSLMQCPQNSYAGVTCGQGWKKKEEDVSDDLRVRAAQLLLELMQDSKN